MSQFDNCDQNGNKEYDGPIFGAIAEFCGKNLFTLRIRHHKVDFYMDRQFKVLNELDIFAGKIANFETPSIS